MLIKAFYVDESGATAIEYTLIISLIFLVILGAVTLFADNATAMFQKVSSAITGK
ncbi:MAG: Flp family type IVb pilin [Robiginitomaculum sp.]|nr:MAG: Flp family type IVb pilin [Robiginitomaculum sp.]